MGRGDVVRGVVAMMLIGACSGPAESDNFVEMCGAQFKLARPYKLVDFGDRFGEVIGGRRWSVFPGEEDQVPSRLEDVFVAPPGFTVDDAIVENGPNRTEFGSFRSADGACEVWLRMVTGSSLGVSAPGLDVEWLVTAGSTRDS